MSDHRERHAKLAMDPGGNRRRPRRSGFSLLEVVLALAVFFMSAAALSQLLRVGTAMARWSERVSEATLRCESKLAEMAASGESPRSELAAPLEGDESWESEVEVAPTGVPGLVRVVMTVRNVSPGERDVEVSLARLVADPSRLEAPKEATALVGTPGSFTVEEMLGLSGAGR